MVMHARKTQRMNDGYFEKHQAHPYQSSKYSSSKSYGSSSDRYERIRDSPNGNYRSDSPDSQSPRERDRSYQSKSSYIQKIREKERENRDYKISRDKYSDCTRSPKDKRSRDSDHRSNMDRNDEKSILHPIKISQISSRDRKPMHNNCVDKRDDRERVNRVGDWSEHVSSSGKKYYYNCKTEVSQWEKPREWVERERDRFRGGRDRDRDSDRNYSSSSRSSGMRGHDKHSNSRVANNSNSGGGGGGGGSSSSKDHHPRESASSSRHWSSGSSRDDSDVPPSKESRSSSSRKHVEDNVQATHSVDMDISPGDSTPTSEVSYGNNGSTLQQHHNQHHQTTQQIMTSTESTQQSSIVGPVLLANALPRLVSHPIIQHMPTQSQRSTTSSSSTTAALSSLPPGSGSIMLPEASPQDNTSGSTPSSNAPGPPCSSSSSSSSRLLGGDGMDGSKGMSTRPLGDSCSSTSVHSALSVDTNNSHSGVLVEGPPTPTHSETPDCTKAVAVPVSSPPGSLSTLQGVSSSLQALRPQGPTITPSLANHYRDDLVNPVRGWPAEIIEKQAQKLAEEAHIMGSIQCSKVSAELKSARSIVRLTEIQATLQEQRILFLRQQIKELEELKSQNSFMSDDT